MDKKHVISLFLPPFSFDFMECFKLESTGILRGSSYFSKGFRSDTSLLDFYWYGYPLWYLYFLRELCLSVI